MPISNSIAVCGKRENWIPNPLHSASCLSKCFKEKTHSMKKIYPASLCLLMVLAQVSKACDCFPLTTFCEGITFGNNGQIADYLSIYQIKVIAKVGNGLQVFVGHTYAGDDLENHQVYIQDGNGADCGLFASTHLAEGKNYIVAASAFVSVDTLTLSECIVSFLPIENGLVKGAIAPGVTEVPLGEFTAVANCGDLSPSITKEPSALEGLSLRPSLARDFVEILSDWPKAVDLKLHVFDAVGRLVFQAEFPSFHPNSQFRLDISNWSSGVYFFRLEMQGKRLTKRVVKMAEG